MGVQCLTVLTTSLHAQPAIPSFPLGLKLIPPLVLAVVCLTSAPAAEPSPSAAAGKAGTLFIVGGGHLPDSIPGRFVELAGGKDARIVIIPTASALADTPHLLPTYAYFKGQPVKSVALLHTRDRDRANEAGFSQPLSEATGVWITGGDQSRVSATYRGTAVERELKRVLARGGVIGGTSAGAAVMSSLMIVGGKVEAGVGTGFVLLDGVLIDQHFQNRNRLQRLLGVLAKHPECPGVGIDEATVLIVRGRSATVQGNGNVLACLGALGKLPASVRVLKDGDKLDLDALIKAASARAQSAAEAGPRTPATSTPPLAPQPTTLLSMP